MSAIGPATMVFSDALKYSQKPRAAEGEIKRASVPSYNKSTFNP